MKTVEIKVKIQVPDYATHAGLDAQGQSFYATLPGKTIQDARAKISKYRFLLNHAKIVNHNETVTEVE